MGVYVLEPKAVEMIKPGYYMDLPDLVLALVEAGEQVGSYVFDGYWLDIGRHEDYERAIAEFAELRHMFVKDEVPAAP
jgi:NDP-sugar pyrophosphorylase family protein